MKVNDFSEAYLEKQITHYPEQRISTEQKLLDVEEDT